MWLKAVAGCGKSSIAGEIAKRAKASNHLGACFYFARGKPERNKLAILEVARQLASRYEGNLRTAISATVKAEPDIAHTPTAYQYQKLIHEPLLTLDNLRSTLAIVLDGLDECEEKYASTLLEHIGRNHDRLPVGVKFFLTSRAEPHIRRKLESQAVAPAVQSLSLDLEGSSEVEADIAVYLKDRLSAVVSEYDMEDEDWPGEKRRRELIRMACGLFIWAATAALLSVDTSFRNPEGQLARLLSRPSINNFDELYSAALDHAFPITVDSSILVLLRDVLGTLIVACTPINAITLASLLPSERGSALATAKKIRTTVLSWLGSVLKFPDGDDTTASEPIQFLHQSFVDFLVTEGHCHDRFLLSFPKQHEQMAIGCLRRMCGDLEQNMCQLMDPSKLNSEVDDMAERIKRHISSGLQYACLY